MLASSAGIGVRPAGSDPVDLDRAQRPRGARGTSAGVHRRGAMPWRCGETSGGGAWSTAVNLSLSGDPPPRLELGPWQLAPWSRTANGMNRV